MTSNQRVFTAIFLTGLGIHLAGISLNRPGIQLIGGMVWLLSIAAAIAIWSDNRQEAHVLREAARRADATGRGGVSNGDT